MAGPSKLDQVLAYAARGWCVLPLCWPMSDGSCSCGRPDCESVGKHPVGRLVPHGVSEATTDTATLTRWWTEQPHANVGVATGARSGFVAFDVDDRHGGDESFRDWEAEHGEFPPTPHNLTGGGFHILFANPGYQLGNGEGGKTLGLPVGIDRRGDGGYIVVPPSVHPNGKRYRWDIGHSLDLAFAPLPPWLGERPHGDHTSVAVNGTEEVPSQLAEGVRNAWLTSFAGSMRRRGATVREMVAALLIANDDRCTPPLTLYELEAIAVSVSRYQPAEVPDGPALETGVAAPRRLGLPPFPIDALPEVIQRFVVESAADLDSVPEIMAVPCLVYASAAIGRTRRIRITARHFESALLWGAIIGDPGSKKSPAIDLSGAAIREWDAKAQLQYQLDLEGFESEKRERRKTGFAPPLEPACERRVVQDTTIEALADILAADAHGLVMDNDELASWIGSFDQYKARGAGADRDRWLQIWGGGDIRVDRRGRERPLLIRRPFVSVMGSIQPDRLVLLTNELGNDGFLARFVFGIIPHLPAVGIHDSTIRNETIDGWTNLIEALLNLKGEEPVPFTKGGSQAFRAGSQRHANEQNDPNLDKRLWAFYAKGVGTAARIALVLHLCRWLTGETEDEEVDETSAANAWRVMAYFKAATEFVVLRIAETETDTTVAEIVEYANRHGGTVTVREAQRLRLAGIKGAAEMIEAFKQVENHGLGRVEKEQIRGVVRVTLKTGDVGSSTDE